MKKALSLIAALALCAMLVFLLASCSLFDGNVEVKAKIEPEKIYESGTADNIETLPPLPREEEILLIIEDMIGLHDYRRIGVENAPNTLKALFHDGRNYAAYTVTGTQYTDLETEGITIFDDKGRCLQTRIICWNTGNSQGYGNFEDNFIGVDNDGLSWVHLVSNATQTSENYRNSIKKASDYILTLKKSDAALHELAIYVIEYACGWSGDVVRIENHYYENGIEAIFTDDATNCYAFYINTYGLDGTGRTGVEAMVVIHADKYVHYVMPLTYDFADEDSAAFAPTADSIDSFFSQFNGLYYKDIDGIKCIPYCTRVCNDFKNAINCSIDTVDEYESSEFTFRGLYGIFGTDVNPFFVVLGLAVVAIVALLVIGALVIVPIAVLIIIVVIIIIIVASKKKKKKKLAAAQKAKSASAPKTAAEAVPETDSAQDSKDMA